MVPLTYPVILSPTTRYQEGSQYAAHGREGREDDVMGGGTRTRTIVIGLVIALAVAVLLGGGWLLGSQVWGGGCCESGFGMRGSHGSPLGMHTFGGGILVFLFWGVIIGGIVLLVIGLVRQGAQAAERGESPLEIVERRYANGDIDREEFERMKELLSSE
jgi:putative membrane protein